MKLNVSKTKTMIVSRSHTMHPQSPPLTIGGTVLKESDDLVILGVTFDSKMIPNQPHLLNKHQINMGFSHFHEFVILSGIYILAPYQIDIVKGCGFCNGNIILI